MFRSDDRKKEKEEMRKILKTIDFAKAYKNLYGINKKPKSTIIE